MWRFTNCFGQQCFSGIALHLILLCPYHRSNEKSKEREPLLRNRPAVVSAWTKTGRHMWDLEVAYVKEERLMCEPSNLCILPTMLTYLRISVTSLRRTLKRPVFAVKCEPQLRSHSLSLVFCFSLSLFHSLYLQFLLSVIIIRDFKRVDWCSHVLRARCWITFGKFMSICAHSDPHIHTVLPCLLCSGICQAS